MQRRGEDAALDSNGNEPLLAIAQSSSQPDGLARALQEEEGQGEGGQWVSNAAAAPVSATALKNTGRLGRAPTRCFLFLSELHLDRDRLLLSPLLFERRVGARHVQRSAP